MANPIINTASFATANMKPDNGEQIDSLWGQNIADNTGYLFYKPAPASNHSVQIVADHINGLKGGNWKGTQFFIKPPGHNTLFGSYVTGGTTSPSFGGTHSFYVNGSLVKVVDLGFAPSGTNSTGSISVSISGLTDGAIYTTSYNMLTFIGAQAHWLDLTLWTKP